MTATGDKTIKPVTLQVCTKSATSKRTDEQHCKFLNQRSHTTEYALSLLETNSDPIIKELLQNHLKLRGCVAYLQPGMCNSLKSLIIASYNPSKLCLFHCGPEKVGDDVTEEEIAILTEKRTRPTYLVISGDMNM